MYWILFDCTRRISYYFVTTAQLPPELVLILPNHFLKIQYMFVYDFLARHAPIPIKSQFIRIDTLTGSVWMHLKNKEISENSAMTIKLTTIAAYTVIAPVDFQEREVRSVRLETTANWYCYPVDFTPFGL